MRIDRDTNANRIEGEDTKQRIKFCLDQLENAPKFLHKLSMTTEVVERLTLEEIIGALISAEQYIKGEVD